MDIKNSVLTVGLLMGSLMILSVCFAYVRGRPFGTGGIVLTIGGVILIGLSVFSRISLSVSDEGFEARIQSIEHKVGAVEEKNASVTERLKTVDQNVQLVNEANQVVSEELQTVAKTQRTNTDKVTQLSDVLAARKLVQPEVAEQLRTDFRKLPQVDMQRLQKFQKLNLK